MNSACYEEGVCRCNAVVDIDICLVACSFLQWMHPHISMFTKPCVDVPEMVNLRSIYGGRRAWNDAP